MQGKSNLQDRPSIARGTLNEVVNGAAGLFLLGQAGAGQAAWKMFKVVSK